MVVNLVKKGVYIKLKRGEKFIFKYDPKRGYLQIPINPEKNLGILLERIGRIPYNKGIDLTCPISSSGDTISFEDVRKIESISGLKKNEYQLKLKTRGWKDPLKLIVCGLKKEVLSYFIKETT